MVEVTSCVARTGSSRGSYERNNYTRRGIFSIYAIIMRMVIVVVAIIIIIIINQR